jgi:hypothetical protein
MYKNVDIVYKYVLNKEITNGTGTSVDSNKLIRK